MNMADGVFQSIAKAVGSSALMDPKNWHKPDASKPSYTAARAARKDVDSGGDSTAAPSNLVGAG
jgi:hypothetical protein